MDTTEQFLNKIRLLRKNRPLKVALPDNADSRIAEAIRTFAEEETIDRIVCFVQKNSSLSGLDLNDRAKEICQLIEPEQLATPTYDHLVMHARKRHKSPSSDRMQAMSLDPLCQAGYLLASGQVDAVVAGITRTTADVIRAGLATVDLLPDISTISGAFIMIKPSEVLAFADCAVVIDPTSRQLCDIAACTKETLVQLFPETVPQVAFLSFATKGSAVHQASEKPRQAWEAFRTRHPDIDSDGELQFDAAYLPNIRSAKAPESMLKGPANVYVFPDLQSGNIAYKIAQRLGGFMALGPILQGFAQPYSDLSRGASASDIVQSVYVNLLRSQKGLH